MISYQIFKFEYYSNPQPNSLVQLKTTANGSLKHEAYVFFFSTHS